MPETSLVRRVEKSAKQDQNNQVILGNTCRISKSYQPRAKRLPQSVFHGHEEALLFYYIRLGYPANKVWEMMEAIFKLGASPKQYEGYKSTCQLLFKKSLCTKNWFNLAPCVRARQEMGLETEVVLRNGRVFKSKLVKEYVRRSIRVLDEPKVKRDSERYKRPEYAVDTLSLKDNDMKLTLRTPGTSSSSLEKPANIPVSIIKQLPINRTRISLLPMLKKTPQSGLPANKNTDLGFLNAIEFKALGTLIYKISNNLFSTEDSDRLLQQIIHLDLKAPLKQLFSMDTISIALVCEHLMPILIARGQIDLVETILLYRQQTEFSWYKILSDALELWPDNKGFQIGEDATMEDILSFGERQCFELCYANIDISPHPLNRADARRLLKLSLVSTVIPAKTLKRWWNPSLPLIDEDLQIDSVLSMTQYPIPYCVYHGKHAQILALVELGFRNGLIRSLLMAIGKKDFEVLASIQRVPLERVRHLTWGIPFDEFWDIIFNSGDPISPKPDSNFFDPTPWRSFCVWMFQIAFRMQSIPLRDFLKLAISYQWSEQTLKMISTVAAVEIADGPLSIFSTAECDTIYPGYSFSTTWDPSSGYRSSKCPLNPLRTSPCAKFFAELGLELNDTSIRIPSPAAKNLHNYQYHTDTIPWWSYCLVEMAIFLIDSDLLLLLLSCGLDPNIDLLGRSLISLSLELSSPKPFIVLLQRQQEDGYAPDYSHYTTSLEAKFRFACGKKDSQAITRLWSARRSRSTTSHKENLPQKPRNRNLVRFVRVPGIFETESKKTCDSCDPCDPIKVLPYNCLFETLVALDRQAGCSEQFRMQYKNHFKRLLREGAPTEIGHWDEKRFSYNVSAGCHTVLQSDPGSQAAKVLLSKDEIWLNVLQLVLIFKHHDLVEDVLNNEESPSRQLTNFGQCAPSPLLLAMHNGAKTSTIELLCKKGASIYEVSECSVLGVAIFFGIPTRYYGERWTPLRYIAEQGDLNLVKQFLEREPLRSDDMVYSLPVHLAVRYSAFRGRIDIVFLFLSIDIDFRESALEGALAGNRVLLAQHIREFQPVQKTLPRLPQDRLFTSNTTVVELPTEDGIEGQDEESVITLEDATEVVMTDVSNDFSSQKRNEEVAIDPDIDQYLATVGLRHDEIGDGVPLEFDIDELLDPGFFDLEGLC